MFFSNTIFSNLQCQLWAQLIVFCDVMNPLILIYSVSDKKRAHHSRLSGDRYFMNLLVTQQLTFRNVDN
jgi:hypothetical protein